LNTDTKLSTAILIPAYNEGATIRDIASRCLQQLEQVIVVDDGSTDDTVEQLDGLPITILKNQINSGKAACLWKGMQHALEPNIQSIITLDGDGQHSPEDVPLLIKAANENKDHLVIAARLNNREQAPSARLKANNFADFWVSWAAGQKITDSQSGFRLYPASLFANEALSVNTKHGFVFESEIIIDAVRLGFRCHTVAIDSVYHSGARASHFRPVADITRIVLMISWKLFSRGMYLQGLWASTR
jgi:glycosyltransferase involved in cell wall biosynthesis